MAEGKRSDKEVTESAEHGAELTGSADEAAVAAAAGEQDAAEARAEEQAADADQASSGDHPATRARTERGKALEKLASGTYTALHAMVRNGNAVAPGDTVKFDKDEGQHVEDLLVAGAIVAGTGKEAKDALAQADLARGQAATA